MRRFLLAALFLSAFSASPVFAVDKSEPLKAPVTPPVNGPHNATPLAQDLLGIWAAPDCSSANRVMVIAPHYVLLSQGGQVHILAAVQNWRQEPDSDGDTLYAFSTNIKIAALMKKTNDGLVRVLFKAMDPRAPLTSGWGAVSQQGAPEYAHCAKFFDDKPGVSQEETDTPFVIDAIYTGCSGVTSTTFKTADSCHQAIFKTVDTDKNKMLDAAELSRLYRQLSYAFVGSIKCTTETYPGNSVAESEEFASMILGTGKTIAYEDLKVRLAGPDFVKGRIYSFAERARNLQQLLDFMPQADSMRTCALADPEKFKRSGTIILPPETPRLIP
jgi:hypothetical protein